MKSSDVPHLTPPPEPRRAKPAPAEESVPAALDVSLTPAGESSDPAVHRLLSLRQAYNDAGDEAGLADVTARLAALGYR